jgi:hypothetical protein
MEGRPMSDAAWGHGYLPPGYGPTARGSMPEVTVEEATPEVAVRIAIRELEQALARPDHFGVYVHSALIWLRGLDGAA